MESAETTTNRSDAVERLHEQLQDSLQELVTSEDWQRALAVAARFHDYSFANTRLIWAQSLARGFTPSRVAGYRAWQELGRHVRRGERGLQILAPVIRKITPENGDEEERRVVGFRVVHVFDIAQTDGEPLPEVTAVLVEGDLPSHWERVGELITGAGFGLQVADLDRLGNANGITDWQQKASFRNPPKGTFQRITPQPCQRDASNHVIDPPTARFSGYGAGDKRHGPTAFTCTRTTSRWQRNDIRLKGSAPAIRP